MVEKMTDFSENKNYNVGEILVPYEIPDMENFNGIMFVAEAPGANEEENQKPLVGISGKNFDEWLREAKIKRKDSIIANVFRFRPLENVVDNFFCSDKISKEQKVEIDTTRGKCRGKNLIKVFIPELKYLNKTIVKYKPIVIVPMGGIASWALTGLDKISTIQGHLFRKSFVHKDKKHNCIILPAFHPSSALEFRTPANADLIIKVFKEARKITRKD